MEYYAQFPDSSLSPGIYGSFGVKQIIEGIVGISLELCLVHQGTSASTSGNGSNWGDIGGDVL